MSRPKGRPPGAPPGSIGELVRGRQTKGPSRLRVAGVAGPFAQTAKPFLSQVDRCWPGAPVPGGELAAASVELVVVGPDALWHCHIDNIDRRLDFANRWFPYISRSETLRYPRIFKGSKRGESGLPLVAAGCIIPRTTLEGQARVIRVNEPRSRRFQSALLVGEDRSERAIALVRALHEGGFAVLQRPKCPAALELARSGEFDVVFWWCEGLGLRDLEALGAVARSDVPVIAVLDEALADAVAECLMAGADACLQADAPARVVVAQSHAVLRRRGLAPAASESLGLLQIGDLVVDLDRCEVERGGEYIPLTASEFRILAYLAKNAGRVLAPHEILNAVSDDYEYRPREAQEVLKVYIRRIRRKLEPSPEVPRYLVTVRGFGYRLEGGTSRERILPATASTA